MVERGAKAPDFRLPGNEGKIVGLEDFPGKWRVLFFYPKDGTKGWTEEAKAFSDSVSVFDSEGAVVMGISADSVESHRNFAKKHDLNVLLLSDKERIAVEAYGAWGKKKMYGKEHEGIIRSTFLVDPRGVVRWVWPSVKVPGHANEVLETLREVKKAEEQARLYLEEW